MEEDEMQGENKGENRGTKAVHYKTPTKRCKGVVDGLIISQGGVATSWSQTSQEESGKVSRDAIVLVAGNRKARSQAVTSPLP